MILERVLPDIFKIREELTDFLDIDFAEFLAYNYPEIDVFIQTPCLGRVNTMINTTNDSDIKEVMCLGVYEDHYAVTDREGVVWLIKDGTTFSGTYRTDMFDDM